MTNGVKGKDHDKGDCEYCEAVDVKIVKGMCLDCAAKSIVDEPKQEKSSEVEVVPSNGPINDRLRKAYHDKWNDIVVSGMKHDELKAHIADLEDMVRVLQAQVQASMAVDDEWSKELTKEAREALREKDRAYRAKARPRVNTDGTLKTSKPAKPKEDIAEGNAAFESLVKKLMNTGMTREAAINGLRGMKK
jgi:hypothetical protein